MDQSRQADRRQSGNIIEDWNSLGRRTRREVKRLARSSQQHPEPLVRETALYWGRFMVDHTKPLLSDRTRVRRAVRAAFLAPLLFLVGNPPVGSAGMGGSPDDRRLALAILDAAGEPRPER